MSLPGDLEKIFPPRSKYKPRFAEYVLKGAHGAARITDVRKHPFDPIASAAMAVANQRIGWPALDMGKAQVSEKSQLVWRRGRSWAWIHQLRTYVKEEVYE